ncbi:hypothetical protein CEXT_584861 [Caerostris extrusa]|uniref:Uncharacterized protein n=1 Tax=Caerostris extrusa TaxID=172846 RepID=A0AAV4STB1_CAEEX|nr:hypothetical protein CEXT_584861 [Caerostris extrusa]
MSSVNLQIVVVPNWPFTPAFNPARDLIPLFRRFRIIPHHILESPGMDTFKTSQEPVTKDLNDPQVEQEIQNSIEAVF